MKQKNKPIYSKHSCKLQDGKLINNICWTKEFALISRINIFVIIGLVLTFILGMVAHFLSFQLKEVYLSIGIACLIYSAILFIYGKYFFAYGIRHHKRNVYIEHSIKKSSINYKKSLLGKYISIIIYQVTILFPFTMLIALSINGIEGETSSSSLIWYTIPFYLSWVFLIFFDYENSIVGLDDSRIRFRRFKKIFGFIIYAFFWSFMINPTNYKIKLDKKKKK